MPVSPAPHADGFLRCYITDRRSLPRGVTLPGNIARNLQAGIQWVQIREKDLDARQLWNLTREILELPGAPTARVIVNTRVDVALATGAAGAHLPAGSPPPQRWRAITPPGFLIGVSCHTLDEVRAAQDDGADYALFGPVFPPRSKPSDLNPRGLDDLAQAVRAVQIPVLALGGIAESNIRACVRAGAAGIAAISLYQYC